MKLNLDASHPLNQQVLRYLSRNKIRKGPLLGLPESVKDAYYGQGSHPDVVERVWDQLGGSLPVDCRCLVHGTPALVHPRSGIIFAICNGTQYNFRLTDAGIRDAIAKGIKTVTRWSSGKEMSATQVLGEDWVFGAWLADEPSWCKAMYESLSDLK